MSSESARRRTYFISDVHLGASYMPDRKSHEARVTAFLRSIRRDAKALYLLGDILDYWFEYRTVVPRGYIRFFGELAALSDAGVRITWFIGNHDIWLFDYLRDEIGLRVVDTDRGGIFETIDGIKFFLGHGDTFGHQPRGYMMLRRIFHNRLCQKMYAALHPRWTLPFAHGWSSHSRKAGQAAPALPVFAPKARTATEVFARQLCSAHPDLRYIIIGHHHVALDEPVTGDCRLLILGNWISSSTYAVFDGETLALKEFEEGRDEIPCPRLSFV